MIAATIKLVPVGLLAFAVHGTSTADLVVLFAAIGWAVMIAKDIRPIKALRIDLAESRREVAERDAKIAALDAKLVEEKARGDKLEASRDFSTALGDALSSYEGRAEERMKQMIAAFSTHDKAEQKAWEAITASLDRIVEALSPPAP